jgi:hypothetical protein
MTRLSTATDTAPAAGPKSRAAVIVNVSEIEKLTGTVGNRSVALPLTSVRPIRIYHGSGTGVVAS